MATETFDIDKLLDRVLEEANRLALDAGMGGHYHDGGAGELRKQVEAFKAGIRFEIARQNGLNVMNSIPEPWQKFVDEFDPEFARYLILKKKFGGR